MNIAVVTFSVDEASVNERAALLKYFTKLAVFSKFDGYDVFELDESSISGVVTNKIILLHTDTHSIDYEDLDGFIFRKIGFKADLIIFCTKHQSASGIHSLSTHCPGNWGKADYGGVDGKLCVNPVAFTNLAYMKLKEVNEKNKLNYEVIMECTHHGPYIKTPCAFIEIGSDLESWKREDAGKAIAEVLVSILPDFTFELPSKIPVAFGIGGLHHTPEFAKRIERGESYISHVCPKYMLNNLTEESIVNAITNSVPKCNLIMIDWKGLGQEKERILPIIEKVSKDLGIEVKKTKDF
jgi:D-aminoacyl-tRNA deacylase